jgi:hypothetical protein
MDRDDQLLAELARSPALAPTPPPMAASTAARVACSAHAALRESRWLSALGRLYFRAEPALAASVVVLYLGWAIQTVIWLKR